MNCIDQNQNTQKLTLNDNTIINSKPNRKLRFHSHYLIQDSGKALVKHGHYDEDAAKPYGQYCHEINLRNGRKRKISRNQNENPSAIPDESNKRRRIDHYQATNLTAQNAAEYLKNMTCKIEGDNTTAQDTNAILLDVNAKLLGMNAKLLGMNASLLNANADLQTQLKQSQERTQLLEKNIVNQIFSNLFIKPSAELTNNTIQRGYINNNFYGQDLTANSNGNNYNYTATNLQQPMEISTANNNEVIQNNIVYDQQSYDNSNFETDNVIFSDTEQHSDSFENKSFHEVVEESSNFKLKTNLRISDSPENILSNEDNSLFNDNSFTLNIQ